MAKHVLVPKTIGSLGLGSVEQKGVGAGGDTKHGLSVDKVAHRNRLRFNVGGVGLEEKSIFMVDDIQNHIVRVRDDAERRKLEAEVKSFITCPIGLVDCNTLI